MYWYPRFQDTVVTQRVGTKNALAVEVPCRVPALKGTDVNWRLNEEWFD